MLRTSARIFVTICSFGIFSQAHASAFQIFEQNANETGIAYAGMASAVDASAAFYNPAGMVFLDAPEVTFGASYASVKLDFLADVNFLVLPLSIPSATGNTRNITGNFGLAVPVEGLPHDITFGFSVTTPFAFETNYENSLTQAYATRTYLQAINFNPSVAFKITDKLSVGVGANAQQLKTIFDAAAGLVVFTLPIEYDMQGWAYTWNAGVTYEILPKTFIGASYRPKLGQEISGTARAGTFSISQLSFSGLLNAIPSFPVVSYDASTKINLPATTSFGFRSDITDKITLMGNVAYTQWDTFENVVLNSTAPLDLITLASFLTVSIPDSFVTTFDFKNTWFFALGANYEVFNGWTLLGGVAWDQTPTQDAHRELRIPDQDRFELGCGLKYQANENFSVTLAYQHFFLPEKAKIQNLPFTAAPLAGSGSLGSLINELNALVSYSGNVKASADVGAVQFTWEFI